MVILLILMSDSANLRSVFWYPTFTMNKNIKNLIVIAAMILLSKESVFSQSVQTSRKYRVIAYKAGNPQITGFELLRK